MKKFEEKMLSAKQKKALDLLINSNLKNYEIAEQLKITQPKTEKSLRFAYKFELKEL